MWIIGNIFRNYIDVSSTPLSSRGRLSISRRGGWAYQIDSSFGRPRHPRHRGTQRRPDEMGDIFGIGKFKWHFLLVKFLSTEKRRSELLCWDYLVH